MPVYKIAELPILIDPVTEQTEKRLQPYLCDSAEYEFDASVSREEIEAYIEKSKTPCLPYLAENALVLTKISRTVLSGYNGCFFHSSCLELDGEGYLFTALSGTGKSTHTANWRRYFGALYSIHKDHTLSAYFNTLLDEHYQSLQWADENERWRLARDEGTIDDEITVLADAKVKALKKTWSSC